jgi:hypothetical protein
MLEPFKKILNTEIKEISEFDQLLKDNLNLSLSDCQAALEQSLSTRAGEVAADLPNLAPFGDYSKMTEDPIEIERFLREEASKSQHWEIYFAELRKKDGELLELIFSNKAADDGELVKGYVFVGVSGKIRHAFCQAAN